MKHKILNDKKLSISLILIGFSLLAGISQYIFPENDPNNELPNQSRRDASTRSVPEYSGTGVVRPNGDPRRPPTSYLVLGGDIMLSRNIGYLNKQQGYDRIFNQENYNPTSAFSNCKIENCLLVFNLESLFHPQDNDIPLGGFNFKANTQNIETLLQLRQNKQLLLSLSNNHIVNGGYEGITTTQQLLSEHHIRYVGAGTSKEQSRQIATIQQSNIKICFQSYSYEGKYNIKIWAGNISRNPIIKNDIRADLSLMKENNCDVKAIILHRGAEYRISPTNRQKTLAHECIENGADIIIGGHSHIPGEFEKYKGKYIFYSFGNFIFDQDRGKNARGWDFDYTYDHELAKKTTPTYISLLAGLQLQKFKSWVRITLDQIEMSRMTNGVHSPLDPQSYEEILQRIAKK